MMSYEIASPPARNDERLKILFFATSEFAIPSLKALVENGHDIAAVITQPDKPAGRHLTPLPSPAKVWALEHNLKVLQPTSLQLSPSPGERVSSSPSLPKRWGGIKGEVEFKDIDLAIVASYGKIIPKEMIDLPKLGTLNIHPSLLPKYRGPSPIQAAILNGDSETGVTIIKLDEKLDHGPIVAQQKLTTYNLQLYYQELHDKLAWLGAELLIEILPDYLEGKVKPVPQDHAKASFTKIITKDDARIHWNFSAEKIEAMVRAYDVWPVAWTTLEGKLIKIYEAEPLAAGASVRGSKAGQIIGAKYGLQVKCGDQKDRQFGVLEIKALQEEGRKKMPALEYLHGHHGLEGKTFK